MRSVVAIVASVVMPLAACSAPNQCRSLDGLVSQTYGFKPSSLDSTHRAEKLRAMDAFWDTVRSRHRDLVPCLRSAVAARTDDPFFQFDGSALLVELDSSHQSAMLQLAALERVDLRDVDLGAWIRLASRRALEGFNTVRAATKWLELPDSAATYYLPQHGAFKVGKAEGALFLFGSLPESLATPALAMIAQDAQQASRETALWLLVQQATEESLRLVQSLSLASFSPDARQYVEGYVRGPRGIPARTAPARIRRDEFVRAFQALRRGNFEAFDSLVVRAPDGETDAAAVLTPQDLPDVRFARRYFIAAGTPEAIGYYRDLTGVIETVSARGARQAGSGAVVR